MRQSLSFVLPVGLFFLILFPYLHYVPMWDSAIYLSKFVLDAVSQPFNLMAFNVSNHSSIFFGLLYGALQYISFGNSLYMHLTSFALLIFGFYFYYRLLQHFFKNQLTVFLGMALLCWNPAVVANAINPTPDLLVMVVSIFCLWAFIKQRIFWAVLAGIGLAFSKESGVLFYGISSFLYLVLFLPATNRFRFFIKNSLYLSIPFIMYIGFIGYKIAYTEEKIFFQNDSALTLLKHIIPYESISMLPFLGSVFLLNFQWVVFLGIMGGLITLYKQKKKQSFFHPFEDRDFVFVLLLTISLGYVISRFPHFFNIRYYLVFFPLTSFLFVYILQEINFKYWRLVVSGLLPLLLISIFYTADPVSRLFFGTFNFGSHTLLNMTSITGECCGYGRDQLVYNLQHTEFEVLLRKFANEVQVNKDDVIVANAHSDFYILQRMVNHDNSLCLQQPNTPIISKNLKVLLIYALAKPNARLFYPQLPNLEMGAFTQDLFGYFKPVGITRVTHHGYELAVMQLEA